MSGDLAAGRHGRPRQPLEEIPQEYAAFKIEQRGIDLIPDAEKKMKPTGLFWLWAGGVFNVEFLFYGTLIMTFGLSVPQAIAAILVGNLTYAFLGFASLQGRLVPSTRRKISPAPSSTFRCRETAGWLIANGFASSSTVASPCASRARIARRVGSASAEKAASRVSITNYLYNL